MDLWKHRHDAAWQSVEPIPQELRLRDGERVTDVLRIDAAIKALQKRVVRYEAIVAELRAYEEGMRRMDIIGWAGCKAHAELAVVERAHADVLLRESRLMLVRWERQMAPLTAMGE